MPLVECLWVRRDRTGADRRSWPRRAAALLLQAEHRRDARPRTRRPPAPGIGWFPPPISRRRAAAATASSPSANGRRRARRPVGAEDVDRRGRAAAVAQAARCSTHRRRPKPLLGLQPGLLLGSGLFDRVHVGDRVAYLCALSDLREGAAQRKLEVRLRAPRASDDDEDDTYRTSRSSSPTPAMRPSR